VVFQWPLAQSAWDRNRGKVAFPAWHGTLFESKRDGSGLEYARNRVYDPATGRFSQEDPIGLGGGLNAYGFTEGDPINVSDPFGLCAAGDTIRVTVTVQCPGGSIEQQQVTAIRVRDPAAAGDLIAIASAARIRGDKATLALFLAGNEALVDAALFGSLYVHPTTTAEGGHVLTAGGAAGTNVLSFRSDVWANIRARRSRAMVGGLRTCAIVAHEGMHLALSARGTPDPTHQVLTPGMTGRIGCR
jgi:RHS repeat-associated protein